MDFLVPFLVAAAMPVFVLLGLGMIVCRTWMFCVSAVRAALGASRPSAGGRTAPPC